MFKMISWPQFLAAVAVLLVLYYVYVAVVFYRAELMGLLNGRGKATAPDVAPAVPSLPSNGPLIPKAAIVLPAAPAVTPPAVPQPEAPAESKVAEQSPEHTANNDVDTSTEVSDDIMINSGNSVPNQEVGGEVEELDQDFTIGVAQLSDYFERAAGGEITEQQLVEEVPALENTELLMAFYKKSAKSAQQLTAALYADVAEPAIN